MHYVFVNMCVYYCYAVGECDGRNTYTQLK